MLRALALDHGEAVLNRRENPSQRGAVLVEFGLIALVLYLLLGALLSFGTMIQAGQVAQDVARLAARDAEKVRKKIAEGFISMEFI